MLKLSSKEFDLNTLFSFESLKEILLELAKSQIQIQTEIKNINQQNEERDKKILSLKKLFNNNNNLEIIDNNEEEKESDSNNGEDDLNLDDNDNIKDNYNESIKINKEIKNEQNILDNKEEKAPSEIKKDIEFNDNNKIYNKQKYEDKDNSNSQENINKPKKKETQNITQNQNKNQSIPYTTPIYNISKNDNSNVSPTLIKKMMKQLNEHKSRIQKLEENTKNEFKNIKEEETKITNLTFENKSIFNLAQEKIDSLIQNNQEIEKKIESLQSDVQGLDIMKAFQDDGSGTIDATKVMVKALQEKVFKKFELVEQRYKKDGLESAKTKTALENILPKLDMIKRDIEQINDNNKKNKEDFEEFIKSNENIRNETKENIDKNINKKIENIKEENNNKIKSLEEKLENLNNLIRKNLEISLNKEKETEAEKDKSKISDQEFSNTLGHKLSEFSKKINSIENTLKSHLNNPDINNIKKEILDIKSSLNLKLTKDSLKELNNDIITNFNDINDLKDRIFSTDDEIKKVRDLIRTAFQKIESFQGNLMLMQNNISSSTPNKKLIDFSKYVEENKLKEYMNPILKEIENINKELESIRRDMNEGNDITKNSIIKIINKLDDENKNLIKDLKLYVQKKYLDKLEFTKTLKTLEIQIKLLTDDKKKDSESWLLGKRNLQCFNCASCESNIKNDNYTTADYLAWKKYPKGEKIHRMGQGFSHMLEMISQDFAKNIEKNEIFNEDSDNNNNDYTHTLPNKERASSMRIKQNKNENAKNLKIGRNLKRMKLPKMFTLKKYDIDGNNISDEDKRIYDEKDEYGNIEGNPRIMKIFKKAMKYERNINDNFKTIDGKK